MSANKPNTDRPTREKALASLHTYLTSTHQFNELELLKIWKGLFFCTRETPAQTPLHPLQPAPNSPANHFPREKLGMFHTSSPLPQQRLSRTLSSLLLSLPPALFLPFLTAFYKILTSQYAQLPSLRLDKYLYLLRRYVSASFSYLARHNYPPILMRGYLDLVAGDVGPLSCGRGAQARVPDGVRYHVLDFWVPELKAVLREREPAGREQGERFMEPVRALGKDAKGKVVRRRAREVLRDWEDESEGDDGVEVAGMDSDSDCGSAHNRSDHVSMDNGSEDTSVPHTSKHTSDDEWDGFGDYPSTPKISSKVLQN